MQIDKEIFLNDIEEKVGIQKYKIQEVNITKNYEKMIEYFNFIDLGETVKEFFKKNQEYNSSILDIERTCEISTEEANSGCIKEIKIKKILGIKERIN